MSAMVNIRTDKIHPRALELKKFLSERLVGQQRAIERITSSFNLSLSPLKDPQTPIFVGLFLGGTGTGKTYTAELVAEFFSGKKEGMTKIMGPDFSEDHLITSLTGSSHSYVGYDDPPILTQDNINSYVKKNRMIVAYKKNSRIRELIKETSKVANTLRTKDEKLTEWDELLEHYKNLSSSLEIQMNLMFGNEPIYSVILIDEFEKSSHALWNLLLEISSKGQTAIKGRYAEIVSFRNSFIFLTSNLASDKLASLAKNGPTSIGFRTNQADKNINWHVAVDKLRKVIPPELFNRIEENTIVFKQPSADELKAILDLEFKEITDFLWKKQRIFLKASNDLLEFIFKKSSDHPEFGGRQARKRIKKYIREKLAGPLNNGEINRGDVVFADINKKTGAIFFQKDISKSSIKEVSSIEIEEAFSDSEEDEETIPDIFGDD